MRSNPLIDDDNLVMKAERVGKIAAGIIFFLFFAFFVWWFFTPSPPDHPPRVLPDHQKIKIAKYCAERRIHPDVIEISSNGRMTYMLDGKLCEIK